jgi:DNA-binding response OmpR family regulator
MSIALIYICEDDMHLGPATQQLILEHGFDCLLFMDAESLDAQCDQQLPDVLLLDNELPGENGFSIAARYRQAVPNMRIIMMSVLSQKHHLKKGYEVGAMLYLPKPFEPEALIACLRGLFHDLPTQTRLTLNIASHQLHHSTGFIELTETEAKLLCCLSIRSPQVVEYFEIMEAVGLNLEQSRKTSLEVIVSRLRRKLKPVDKAWLTINNKQSVGYSIAEPLHVIKGY